MDYIADDYSGYDRGCYELGLWLTGSVGYLDPWGIASATNHMGSRVPRNPFHRLYLLLRR